MTPPSTAVGWRRCWPAGSRSPAAPAARRCCAPPRGRRGLPAGARALGVQPRGARARARRAGRAAALDAMETAYASAAIGRFAAWVHEGEEAMREALAARGYALVEATRAM